MSTLEYRSAVEEPGDQRWWSWIGWAVYLGMSWTWCIGMFLPGLLINDYGLWGWVVFAIPNVIGAAAVGWINRTAEQSAQTVQAHRVAMISFSIITASFQIFFACWLLQNLVDGFPPFVKALAGSAVIATVAFLFLRRFEKLNAVVFLLLCVLCACEVFRSGDGVQLKWIPKFPRMMIHDGLPKGLFLLAISTCFGFLTCPHLDLTFHRTRQVLSTQGSRIAFSLGLGVIFLAMIFFSIFYNRLPITMWDSYQMSHAFIVGAGGYIILHLVFTTSEHLKTAAAQITRRETLVAVGLLLLSGIIGGVSAIFTRWSFLGFFGGEFVYRIFLGFYGLMFPAYVWICMLPGRWVRTPARRQWLVLSIAVIAALPAFWLAFIERKMQWILLGVGIPLIARLFVRTPVQQ